MSNSFYVLSVKDKLPFIIEEQTSLISPSSLPGFLPGESFLESQGQSLALENKLEVGEQTHGLRKVLSGLVVSKFGI